jgi:cell division GTPase FtsZ
MYKGMVAIASALVLIALGSLAQAGNGAQGTPQKYQKTAQTHHSQITEFSSSSAMNHPPKR